MGKIRDKMVDIHRQNFTDCGKAVKYNGRGGGKSAEFELFAIRKERNLMEF